MPDEVVQVQLTEDGSRPVDLPSQFKNIGEMVKSYTELQGAHTRLSQANVTPEEPGIPKTKKIEDGLTVEMRSAVENIRSFNETQRKVRFTAQVGPDGMKALETYLTGEAIDPGMKAAYDAAILTGNEAMIDANFALIRSTFEAEHGTFEAPSNLVAGAATGYVVPAGTKAFASLDEQLAAQKDPKYDTDPAYRDNVEQRIAISGPYRV